MRLICAIWVAVSHLGAPPVERIFGVLGMPAVEAFAGHLTKVCFCGPAAVMVFFAISGFCIHLPFAGDGEFKPVKFCLSRLTRIGLPLVATIGIFEACGVLPQLQLILWSIYCEIAYYLLYPLLRGAFRSLGVLPVIVAAFVASALVVLLTPWTSSTDWRPGIIPSIVLLSPVWLVGCLLAQKIHDAGIASCGLPTSSSNRLAAIRLTIFALSVLALVLHFHSRVGYRYTMPLFALPALVWLAMELKNPTPSPSMASMGKACYSIYLTHPLAASATDAFLPGGSQWGVWFARALLVTIFAFAFYRLVERPSHRFARSLRRG